METPLGVIQLMRHYGAPVRLLDWTRSPYIAAYFACSDHRDEDGVIWMISMNEFTTRYPPEWSQRMDRLEKAADIHTWAAELDPDQERAIYLIHPEVESERMLVQQGLFTLCTRLGECHEDPIADVLPETRRAKAIIPAKLKPRIMNVLQSMNISGLTLFPGPDGLGRHLQEVARFDLKIAVNDELRKRLLKL